MNLYKIEVILSIILVYERRILQRIPSKAN